jgi:hypothetical protein
MYSKRTWWPVFSFSVFSVSVLALAISLTSASAQNLPPPGAYKPIPNFTGVGAGLQFREAINDRFSGAQPMAPEFVAPSFANLPAEQDGALLYCKDCRRSTPCVSGGSGAWALGTRGNWSCSTGALEASLNANGNKLIALGNGTATGDSLAFGQTGAQLNTLAGAKGDGTDAISAFNVNGVFNVKAFGAKCDGNTDDAAAIQSALTAANTSGTPSGSATVFVPATASSCKISRPIVNASPTNQRTVALFGAGATATTISPTFTGPAIVLVGQGPASQLKTSLGGNIIPGGSGNSMTWASGSNDYFDLSEVLPSNINVQPYVGAFNGSTQWDIRLFFKPADLSATHCLWASTGAFNTVLYNGGDVGGGGMGYLCTESDGKLHGMLNVSGTLIKVASSALTVNNVYEAELNLDSSHNVNLFVGTGGTVTRVAQTASAGTAITQRADENNLIGNGLPTWPYALGNGVNNWQGSIQSVQISNIARQAGTSYSEDTSNFATDGNTLFLDNFDFNQFPGGVAIAPITQVDTPANAWMALHIGELGCCGGTYNVSGLSITSSTVGIYADAAAVDISHVTTNASQYGIEVSRTAGFNSFIHDITESVGVDNGAGGVVGILSLGGITFIRDVILNQANMFPIYTTGSSVVNAYIAANNRTMCQVGVETFGEGVNLLPVHLEHIVEDSENGGTAPGVCISGSGAVSITGSTISPSASGISSVQLIGAVGAVTFANDSFIQNTAPIVDATYATPTTGQSVIFDNDVYAGSYTPAGTSTYTNFNFPYSPVGHTPNLHHIQYGVGPMPEPGVSGQTFCSSTNTCAYTAPADAHVGDVEIAAIDIENGAPGTVTVPAGWTLACTADNGANGSYVAAYWHIVTPDDASTYTWSTSNGSLNFKGGIVPFSGVNQLSPVDLCVASTANSAASISLTGGTSADQNDIDVFMAGDRPCCSATVSLLSPPSGTALAFLGQNNAFGMWSYLPGSTTLPAVTVNSSGSAQTFAGIQLALKPGRSQTSLMPQGAGAVPLYQGEPGATLASLATSVPIEVPNVVGTVTTNTAISFAKQSVQDITTATSGLTYTLSTVGVTPNQDVMIRSHIAGSITGPLWTTSSGAIKWAGGSAPTSSGTSGYTDILRLYFDGTNWQEVSRSIGNH